MKNCLLGPAWMQVPGKHWCYDTIHPIKGGASLQHSFDNTEEGCDYLVLRHDPLNTSTPFSTSFRIRHGYPPSSMNNWQLAIGATFYEGQNQNWSVPFIRDGLVIGVNYSGSDDLVKIWRVENGLVDILCTTTLNYQEQVGTDQAPYFLVEGDGSGNIDLYWSPDPAAQDPQYLGSCLIGDMNWGRQIIIRYCYTSARDRALWLDELELKGHFEPDTIAPELNAVDLVNANTLQLYFSEAVRLSEASTFILYYGDFPEGVRPDSIWENGVGAGLRFPVEFPNRVSCSLLIEGLTDMDGNLIRDTLVTVMRNEARWGDLVFNEIMADPDPAVRYGEEYLELLNRSDYPVSLEGWKLLVNERSYLVDSSFLNSETGIIVPGVETRLELLPGSYMCLYGITLPNAGAVLSLFSREGTLVHAASYRIPWDSPDWKEEGGWSLESPDADLVCKISSLWEYSNDTGGGTPGRINSNRTWLEDRAQPVLLFAGTGNPGELFLHYNEPVLISPGVRDAFSLVPGSILPDSFLFPDPLGEVLELHFPVDFRDYLQCQVQVSGMVDCMGNTADEQQLMIGAVEQATSGSLLINEIMYDPDESYPEYVELFLPGDRLLDLQDFAIQVTEEGETPDHLIALSSCSRLVLPGQYLVLTDCVPHLRDAYGLVESGQWVEVEGLPGLKNSSGVIYLTDRAGQVVDRAVYSDAMHMELLDDPGGISLERVSVERSGIDPDNWHSAASISGYATPGSKNSQSADLLEPEKLLRVDPEVFSPDNDGYQDLLQIAIGTGGNDWVISLMITDLNGNRIRVLANNHLAGPTVNYSWDGEGENGSLQPMGFYVIHARAYRPASGEQWIRRKAVGLVYR